MSGNRKMRKLATGLLFCLVLAMASGCASRKKTEQAWVAPPRAGWHDLSTEPIPEIREGYALLIDESTEGLFPAGMAVSRVALTGDPQGPVAREIVLVRDPRNEFLQWNSAFDDLMALSEVFPIAPRDLGGAEAEPAQINAAMRALTARLGLVYAVNQLTPTETELLGVIYDTTRARPVAAIHASAESILPTRKSCNHAYEELDPWSSDSQARARQKFEGLAHACLWELILQDKPPTPTPEEGWIPIQPMREVEWPARDVRGIESTR